MENIDNFGILWLMGSQSSVLDHIALTMTHALTWLPLYLSLLWVVIRNNDKMSQILLCVGGALLCVIVASTICNAIVKPLVARLRPCNTPEVMYLSQIAGNLHSKDYSFFSSHAANTMSLAVYFSLLTRSRVLSIAMLSWSLIVCWTRIYLAQHYLSDVLVGLAVGIIIGATGYAVCNAVYNRIFSPPRFISTQYTSSGYAHLDIDIVVSVIAVTLAYTLMPSANM